MGILKTTAFASLAAQIIVGIIDLYVLTIPVAMEFLLLKQLLLLEFFVQFIEAIFYIWVAYYINTVVRLSQKRYFDWAITTPIMLITLSSYLIFLRITETQGSSAIPSLFDIVENNYVIFIKIVILNALMLFFGYLGEINVLKTVPSVIAGFIPFFAMFYLIYDNYAKHTSNGMWLFYYFVVVWALYGIAALMNYKWKNTSYNILDLFSKNFFGLFLGYIIIRTL